MPTSEEANRPRWRGEPGFFEIWFLVVLAPGTGRGWWLRYTTFAPARGTAGAPRATLWAAAFDAAAAEPAVAAKAILPASAFHRGPADAFRIRVGDATLGPEGCRGEVRAGSRAIAWDLRFAPGARPARRAPRLLEHLPLPTRVAHAADGLTVTGTVVVDGVSHALRDAPAVQKHLWGTRRVEELFWLFCPRFAEDPAARLEASAARLRRHPLSPWIAPVWATGGAGVLDACGLPHAFGNRVESPAPGELRVRAASATRALAARAWCDPRSLVGYVYRDPSGRDLHVAQSDVASCEVERFARPHPLAAWRPAGRVTAQHAAALEFHAPDPLPGVRYLAWDETALRE